MSMRKLISCEFNIDTACVELRYADGEAISIYTPGIEDSFDTTLPMRTELDWLIYNAPLEYAQKALDGTLEQYLREAAGTHGLGQRKKNNCKHKTDQPCNRTYHACFNRRNRPPFLFRIQKRSQ